MGGSTVFSRMGPGICIVELSVEIFFFLGELVASIFIFDIAGGVACCDSPVFS